MVQLVFTGSHDLLRLAGLLIFAIGSSWPSAHLASRQELPRYFVVVDSLGLPSVDRSFLFVLHLFTELELLL